MSRADENVLSLYLKEINKIPLLTRSEEESLARAAAKGEQSAKDKLIKANLRFVVNVAKKYQNQGLPLADLISEGNIGLMNAIERFDVEKGYHFISYAVWWIRQAILKAICEKSRMIRLPLNRANELVQIEKMRKDVQSEGGWRSETAEIARRLDADPDHVAELVNISRDLVSLDTPVYSEKDSSLLGDFVEDRSHQAPEELTVTELAARRHQRRAGHPDPQGIGDHPVPVRPQRQPADVPEGDRRPVPVDEGAHPADREEGAQAAAASRPQREPQGVPVGLLPRHPLPGLGEHSPGLLLAQGLLVRRARQALAGQLVEERRRLAFGFLPHAPPARAVAEVQPAPGACYGHVEQPALLLHAAGGLVRIRLGLGQ